MAEDVFVTGATGYMGRQLSAALLARGHRAPGVIAVAGDALRGESFAPALSERDTLVHLVGTPHPSPWKAVEFRRVDLPSIVPFYRIAERIPSTREGALRLGLVTLGQMIATLVHAAEAPPRSGTIRIIGAPEIREAGDK
jgi:NAD(P)-dependent dehydrogenase (short-subunit alcohol dehydrogenase family)